MIITGIIEVHYWSFESMQFFFRLISIDARLDTHICLNYSIKIKNITGKIQCSYNKTE